MSGTVAGGRKASATNKAKYGDEFYSAIGRLGGSVGGTKKGFAAMTPEERAEHGRRGGTRSKRGKAGEKYVAPHQSLWSKLIKGVTV